jgi:hypothetical protein
METTVRALAAARIRHFVLGIVLGAVAYGVLAIGAAVSARRHPVTGHVTVQAMTIWEFTARWVPAAIGPKAFAWTGCVLVLLALYHLREWRGKGRRYRNQRRRAANELLRADFRSMREL